ncbi:unnamed protein product [Arctia plantaginis]|uniref:Uncharacterized protein n=1 Tax=Arctia plantaginis TaxID=874455 RepID=A0A8S1AB29_ARCPL|nr:unnamed protein product [Arctia plantaginis]
MFDDENDDDECGGQSRYPVMPSLVALQQMKNRLHLAYLGKKLMKWTTLATVKELRKLALEMTEYFVGYGDDFARAFMLLARSRYYYPNLNTIVVQNVGNEAACRVETDYRSVAGVKLLALNVIEETFDPNEHLGIEKGGTAISDAKKAWRDLLKLVVLMLQERKAFDALHAAHNAANKKQNVLGKLVIPRIQNAIAYIKSELEEQEREETFRLKRFKQSKEKKTRLIKEKDKKDAITEEPVFTCPVCLPKAEIPKEVLVKKEPSIKEEPIIKGEPNIIVKKESKFCGCTDPRPELDQSTGKFICPICNLADRNVDINVVACKVCLPEVNEVKERADHLMAHINQVLTLSRFYNKTLSGMDTKESDLSYADIKKALENINSICTCPHMEKQKIEEAKPCGCAICASKDIKSEQKETVDFDKKAQAIDKKPDAPCMTEPSGGGLKDIKPEQTVNDCCKNKLQAIVKKTDAPCLSESSGDGSKGIKPEQNVNDCCKNKPQAIDKKPDAPILPEPTRCPMCGSKDIKSEQKVNDCGCNKKPQAMDKKPDAPCLSKPSGCPMCGSKDVKSEQKVNDCGCNNKPQAMDEKPDAPCLSKPSGCPMCGSKDVKSEQKVNDCGCNNKPQAMDEKPDAPCLSKPSGCPMCGSKDVKSEQKVNDCGCNNKPQTMDKKPDAPILPEPSGCPMCGSKDIKSEQKVNDCGCNNKPQAMDKKPDAPCLSKPSGCPMCGSKDIKSEQKVNDCCKNKPQAIEKKPDAPILPEPSGCLMCGSKGIKPEQKVNDCGCNNKPQAMDKKPDAPCLLKPSGCPMCGSKDIKSEQKVNDCCKNKPQAIEKKPDAPILPEPSGCLLCGSKGIKPEPKVIDCCKNKPQTMDKKPDAPCLSKPSGCPMCGSKDIKSEQKVNDCCKNKPQAIEKKPDAPILPEPSGCLMCGSKGIKPEQKVNDCCKNKPQTMDKKPDAPCLSKPSGCPMCGSKDIKSEQKVNDCGCNNKPQMMDKKPDAPCLSKPSGCPMCGSKDIKSEQKVNDCCKNKQQAIEKKPEAPILPEPSGCLMCGSKGIKPEQKVNDCCKNKPQTMDNKPDAPCLSKPAGCPMCGSKDIKSEQKVNDCGCNNKPQTMDKKPDAPSLSKPSGCLMCGSKDIKSEQKVNDCCKNKPQAIDKKPDAPILPEPSGCPMCGSKDIKSKQKVNDCGCNIEPKATDKKPEAPCLTVNISEQKSEDCCISKSLEKKSVSKSDACCQHSQDTAEYTSIEEMEGFCSCTNISDSAKEKSCCDMAGISKSDYQTYNLCSISAIKSGSCFQSVSNLYQPAPPFFYLYSGPYVHSQTGLHPICNGNMIPQINTISKKCLCSNAPYPGEFKQDNPICTCKSTNNLPSQQPSKELCTCESIEAMSPLTLSLHSLQVDPINMTCKNIFQSYPPTASLPTANLPLMLAKRVAKASEPYLKKSCLKNGDYPYRERCEDPTIEFKCPSNNSIQYPPTATLPPTNLPLTLKNRIAKASEPYLKKTRLENDDYPVRERCDDPTIAFECLSNNSKQSKQNMLCSCKSIQQQTSFSCNSCSTLYSGNLTTNSLSQEMTKPPYFKKSTTHFTDIPQGFLPLLSHTVEETSNTVILSSTSISSDTAYLHSTKENLGTEIKNPLNKFTPKQFMCFSPYTRDGKSRSCDVSERSLIISSYDTTQSDYHGTDETPGCCIFSKEKCITDSLHDIVQKQSPFFSSHTHVVNPRLCSISSTNLCDSPDPQSSRLLSSTLRGVSGTQSISIILDCILFKQCKSSTTQNNSIQKASSTPSTYTKDFSIYTTMTPHNNSPYKRRLDKPGPCNTFETSSETKPSTFKDCSTFVTVAPKKVTSYTCEGRSFGVSEAVNRTEFFKEITQNCCEFTLFNKNENCISFTPYTREGKPGPCGLTLKCDAFSKNNTPNSRKDRSGTYSVQCNTNKETVFSPSFTCNSRSEICGCEKNNMPLSWSSTNSVRLDFTREETTGRTWRISETNIPACSETHTDFQQCTNARPVPYIRERIPGPSGPCEVDNTKGSVGNISTDQLTKLVTCTREGRPGLSDISKTSYNIISQQSTYQAPYISGISGITVNSITLTCSGQGKQGTCDIDLNQCQQVIPNTREGLSGPCDVSETSYIASSQNKTVLLQPISIAPYTREGMPGPCGLSMTNDNARQFTEPAPFTREGRAGPCDISKTNNNVRQFTDSAPYTREGRAGHCDISKTNNKVRQFTELAPYTREGRAGTCEISKTNNNVREFTDPAPYTREGRTGPYDISKRNDNVRQFTDPVPYTREGRAGPCDISNTNNNVRQFTEPAPYTREGRAGPCDISKTNDNVRQFTEPAPFRREGRAGTCEISKTNNNVREFTDPAPYTREGRTGPYDISKRNDNVRQFTDPVPYTREGRAGRCDISKTNDNVRQLTDPAPYTREGRAGPCDISKTNDNVRQFTDPLPYTREGRAGPCDISNTNNNVRQFTEPAPYTREGRAGPCDISKTNDNVRQFTDPVPYTREGRAGPCDISKTNDNVRQFTDPVPYTREGRAGPCDISNTNNNVRQFTEPAPYTREGRAGPCDISKTNDNVRQFTDPVPYTREGRAGPCDISKTNDNVRQFTDPVPYTREGRAGPCDISNTNNNVRQFTEPAPYTREGRAGPCDISKTNDNVRQFTDPVPYTREGRAGPCDISKTNNNIRQPTDPAPFTREGREGTTTAVSHINPDPRQLACQGRIGPCDILGTNNTASFLSKITTIHSSNFASNILQHREPCNVCVKNNITCSLCAMDPSESTNLLSFTRDGNHEACGVSKTNPTASSFYNTALKHYSHNTPYTREGMPGVCGVNKTNFANSQNKHTHQSAYIEPYTREGKPGPCGLSLHNSESPLEEILSRQYTAPGPFTREGKGGPCDISNINYTTNLLNKIDPKQSTHIASHALIKNPEPCSVYERKHFICSKCARDSSSSRNLASCATKGIYGPCGVSEFNNVARSICNLVLKKSTSVTLSKQEGTLGLSETKHIICSCNNNDSIGSKNLQTCIRKDGHEPCSVTMSSVIFNTSSKQCTRLTSFTRESKPGPCGAFETNRITVSNCFELMNEPNTNQSRNFSPFIRVDMPESCSFSERKNILNSLYDRTSKPCAHILPCTGSNKPQICSECERNGIACPLCIIDLKESTNSAPYTREGIPGPCGVSEAKNNISSLGNWEFQILKPYTREGVPGPCGISEKGLTFPHYKLYASYACQLKPGPWNILECPNATGSTKLITSVRKPCNSKPPSKLGQRQSSDKNEFNLCDTQSCLMYQVHTPCGTYHRNGIQFSATSATKDATTYVTAGPCPVQNIREATLRNCSTCDRKITFDTSTPHSTRNYKVRAPHTCMNVTRSLIAIPRFVCSSCRPYAKASAAPVMILPSHVLSMASSFAPSRTCCCKSQISSVLTLKSGHNCDESLYSVGSNKFCSTCGRPASNKANLKTNSAPLLKYVTYANCENCAPSHVSKFEPCADCRNTKLFLSCASNPSIMSVAIGTCASRNHCTSSKAARLPKSAVQTPCPLSQNTAAIISCPTCSKKRREKCVPHASASKQSCSSLVSKDSKAVIDESKFGYFEIGKKKVTKIYRCKNPDGTITDEKRVIIIKTEKKYPEKLESSGFEAGTISDCLKNETNKKRNTNEMDVPKFSRQSKSDTCCNGTNDRMTYPQIRYCISTQDCNNMTVNNNCLEPNHDSSKNSNRFVTAHSIPTGLVCANRLEDTDSGPKCGCENKPPSKYTTLASRARPVAPTPLRYNGLKDTANSQTCDYPDKLRTKPSASVEPTIPACANRLQDSDSGPRCNCADKSLPDITTPVQPTTPVCANRLQDTDSGPKCDCANKSPPLPATLEQLATPVCANRLEDSDSGPKCDCASKASPKPTTVDQPITPICANRLEDTDSGPKCHCANKSCPLPITVDPPTTPVCANRLEDPDSGPKCDCANKSSPSPITVDQPTTPVCANRLEDSDSGPKCDCARKATPKPTTVDQPTTTVCANRLEDTDSGPKCSCANKSPPLHTTKDRPTNPVCANRLEDSDSGPKCDCASKSAPKPTTPVFANIRLQDSHSGHICHCANKSHFLPATIDKPTCGHTLQHSDNTLKCDCARKLTCKHTKPSSKQSQTMIHPPKCSCDNESSPTPTCPFHKPLNPCQCKVINELLPSTKSQDKEVCCSLQKKIGIMKHISDAQENKVKDDREFDYVYIVPSKKTICNKVLKSDVPCSTTNLACCTPKLSYDANVPTSPKKIVPKTYKNRCCSTSDTGKLSIFRGGSMLDALRQLFQSSNSRTQNRKTFDKNICKTCYSPLSNTDDGESLNTPLCTSCKEKIIDESEQDYRLTNYSTETGSPASKKSPSPFGQMSFLSTSSCNINVDHSCPAMVSTVISTDSNDSLMCMRGENYFRNANRNDAATSTRVRDETYMRAIKKGKIEHACVPDVKDYASHTTN